MDTKYYATMQKKVPFKIRQQCKHDLTPYRNA